MGIKEDIQRSRYISDKGHYGVETRDIKADRHIVKKLNRTSKSNEVRIYDSYISYESVNKKTLDKLFN